MSLSNGAASTMILRRRRRAIPANLDAERALLGSVLVDPINAAEHLCGLPPEAFHDCANYAIACAAQSLRARGIPVDATLIINELQGAAEFRDQSPIVYMAELINQTATAANAGYYAQLVRDAWLQRRAQLTIETGLEQLADAGDDFAGALSRVRNDLDAILGGDSATASRFNALSVEKFIDAVKPREYLIDRVLVQGEGCFLTGEEKCFKTSMLVDLAVSLASGGYFLGKFRVAKQQRVYLMTGETGGPGIKELVLAVCDAAQIKVEGLSGSLFVTEELPRLEDDAHLADLTRELVRTKADVLIAEPIYRMVNGEIMPNFVLFSEMLERAQSAAKAAWKRLGRDGSPTVVFAHHNNSRGRSAYGGGLQWRRQWIELSHRLPFDSNAGQAYLKMTTGGSAGHSGCWAVDIYRGQPSPPDYRRVWNVTGFGPIEEVEQQQRDQADDAKLREAMDKVIAALVGLPNGDTQTAIREAAKLKTDATRKALKQLVEDGTVEACDVKKHTRDERGYRLTESFRNGVPGTDGDA